MIKESDKKLIVAQILGNMQIDSGFLFDYSKNPDVVIADISGNMQIDELPEEDVKDIEKEVEKSLPVPHMTNPEMKRLVESITHRADEGYKNVQWMSNILFKLGIFIIICTFAIDVYGIIMKVNWQNLLAGSGVLGGIGIMVIYEATNKLPDKVKNSVADLVQIKVAFFGYWDQLSILMGINNKNVDEALKISDKINHATEETMKRIQEYCESPYKPSK